MKINNLTLLTEVISVIAIVGSLIFVGIQIQQSSRIYQVNAYQDLTNQVINLNVLMSENEELAALQIKSWAGLSLSEIEEYRLAQVYIGAMRQGDIAFLQFQQGYISQEQLEVVLGTFWVNLSQSELFKTLWHQVKRNLSSTFVEYIENSPKFVG